MTECPSVGFSDLVEQIILHAIRVNYRTDYGLIMRQ